MRYVHLRTRHQGGDKGDYGFTIVELMIATLVFSTILLVVTVGVLKFTSAYYKGVNASTTQVTARTISDKVTQAVQFGSATITTSTVPSNNSLRVFCAGGYEFAYTPAIKYGGTTTITDAGVYMMPMSGPSCSTPPSLSGGQQLLGKNMRVTDMELVSQGNSIYTFSLTVAYGDGDLLCTPDDSTNINCNTASTESIAKANLPGVQKVACKLQAGNQFCAVSSVNVSVQKRIGS